MNERQDVEDPYSEGSHSWDDWYRDYEERVASAEQARLKRLQPLLKRLPAGMSLPRLPFTPFFEPDPAAVNRLERAGESDLKWLLQALRDEPRKWFVADVAKRAQVLPDEICEPMLVAAIEEADGSVARRFVDPCTRVFGLRRPNEYLLDVLENGDDFHKTGAVAALYWARHRPSHWAGSEREGTAEAVEQESLADVWLRRRELLLELFVWNENLDLRRALIPTLKLDASAYHDTHKPLVAQAIQIAREHPDDYIRHRLDLHLGKTQLIRPMPPRDPNRR